MNVHSPGREEYERFIKPIAMVSRLNSIWPLEQDHSALEGYLKIFHVMGMLTMGVILCTVVVADVVRHRHDIDEATECALIASAFSLSIVRVSIYSIHRKDVVYVIETMRKDWTEATPEDRVVLKEKCHLSFLLAKQFIVTVFLALGLFMLAPLIDIVVHHSEERVLPFRGYFFVNQTVSPTYEILYAYSVISGGLCGSTIASATTLSIVSTMHGVARFCILQKRLEGLKSDDPRCDEAIIDCVKRHQDAIKYADALERIINVLALGQFVISTGLVCCAGFQITSMMKDKGRLMKYCSFLNSAIFELFLFSYSGNQLITEMIQHRVMMNTAILLCF